PRSLDWAKASMFIVEMTGVGPSKSTCVISTWSGTTFFTTLRASFRMSSMVIGHHFGRSRFRDSGQFHTCLALFDFLVVEHLEAVFGNEGYVDSFAGDGVAFHRGGHRADREVRALVERHVVLVVVFEDPVHVRTPRAPVVRPMLSSSRYTFFVRLWAISVPAVARRSAARTTPSLQTRPSVVVPVSTSLEIVAIRTLPFKRVSKRQPKHTAGTI